MNSLAEQENEVSNDDWADLADDEATKERKAVLKRYRSSLDNAQDSPVYEYLTSDKGYTKNEIVRLQLGYCETTKSLVVPISQGRSSANLTGFLYRPVERLGPLVRAKPYEESLPTSSILLGDPDYVDEHALIIVSDPLDLYRLRIGTDLTTDGVSPEFSAAIIGSQISEAHARRLKELNPRSIVFIRGEEARAKELEGSIRKFCLNEVIRLAVVALGATDVSEYIKTHGEVALKEEISKAIRISGLLDRTARNSSDLLSWLATQPPALQTGYKELDKSVRIPVGAMTIIAGRPKHGKTTFLYNLLMQMVDSGLYTGKKFYFFSFEESGNRIKQKMLSRILQKAKVGATSIATKHGLKDVRTGEDLFQQYALKRQEKPDFSIPEIKDALATLDELLTRFEVVNDRFTVEELDKMIRKLNEREAIGAIFIDYMQRIRTDKERNTIRENMNHVSDVLKWCAVNTGLSLIVGAQIGRKADEKGRPTQSDIKESGNLEEDANLVLCVYNETQAEIDQGIKDSSKNSEKQKAHTIKVYTLNSRDSEPSETEFVMTNRYFKER